MATDLSMPEDWIATLPHAVRPVARNLTIQGSPETGLAFIRDKRNNRLLATFSKDELNFSEAERFRERLQWLLTTGLL